LPDLFAPFLDLEHIGDEINEDINILRLWLLAHPMRLLRSCVGQSHPLLPSRSRSSVHPVISSPASSIAPILQERSYFDQKRVQMPEIRQSIVM